MGDCASSNDPLFGEEPPPIITCQFDLGPGEVLAVDGHVLSALGSGEDVLCMTATATASDACGKRLSRSATAVSHLYGWFNDPAECAAASPSPVCPPSPFFRAPTDAAHGGPDDQQMRGGCSPESRSNSR